MDAMELFGDMYSTLNGKNRARVTKEVYTLLEEQQRQNIKSFDYNGQEVRTVEMNGQPWFVAADVCMVLEIGNPSQAASRLDDDEKGIISNDTPGGKQKMTIVSESGLYSLILGSRKPEAKQFKRWITHEVIPSIRKTGGYIADRKRFRRRN